MKVSKDSMVVIKGIKKDDLYYLLGETLTRKTSVAIAPENSKAMLWHNKLGHISERGRKIMGDQKLLGKEKVSKVDFCEHCIL